MYHIKLFILTYSLSVEGSSNVDHINDNGFDTIALAFYFGYNCRHFITVESVIDFTVDIVLFLKIIRLKINIIRRII